MQVLRVTEDNEIFHVDPARILELAEKLRNFDVTTMRVAPRYHQNPYRQCMIHFDDAARVYNPKLPQYRAPLENVSEEEIRGLKTYFETSDRPEDVRLLGKMKEAIRRIDDAETYMRLHYTPR